MADSKSNPAIPAWQRAQKQHPANELSSEERKNQEATITAPSNEVEKPSDTVEPASTEAAAAFAREVDTTEDATAASQIHNMRTFLEDPAVKDAPMEKKRAFFESKGISKDIIDQVLNLESPAFDAKEFDSFKQAQSQPTPTSHPQPQSQPQQQRPAGPPIITYPEFLMEAHKPPPLVTPGRILNTAYIASGLAALIYGASKYLVTPMSESLSESRHDFAQHSQSKVDEMNDRLGKLVSKTPESKKDKPLDPEASETESDTSDPTELYHRDIGTQTSPPPSRCSSTDSSPLSEKKKDMLSYQSNGLDVLKSHLTEILERTESLEQPNKERIESVNKLRLYLDTLMYASPGISVWSTQEETGKDGKDGKEDLVEELKREIRGVKGVLLSAKRFPGVAGRVGV